MTKDRNLCLSIPLRKKGDSNSSIAKIFILALKWFGRWQKSSRRQGKHAIDQVMVENEQSDLRVKDELATRMELESPRRASCRMRSFRGYIEGCC